MKNKRIYIVLILTVIVLNIVLLVTNLYFLATKPKSASGVFDLCKVSVLEVKAETENIGVSYGTAEIISKDGILITNAHVITYSNLGETFAFNNVSVRFIDEEEFRTVTIIKYDLELDVAVLKLNIVDREIVPIKIGDSSQLKSGDTVYAVGNLSNYGISITSGIVSNSNINIAYNNLTKNVIQCNLIIAEGNSGGSLIDNKGRLVGITTFRLKDQSNNVVYGIAYSLPINTVMEYVGNY